MDIIVLYNGHSKQEYIIERQIKVVEITSCIINIKGKTKCPCNNIIQHNSSSMHQIHTYFHINKENGFLKKYCEVHKGSQLHTTPVNNHTDVKIGKISSTALVTQ
jgi:hypothetical protein